MTCESYRESLSALFDGELEHDDQGAVFAHLGQCPACRTHFAELLELRSAFLSIEQPTAPAILERRVTTRMKVQKVNSVLALFHQWLTARLTVPVPVAIVAALLLLLGSLVFRSQRTNGNGFTYIPILPEVEVVASPTLNNHTNP